MSSRPVPASTSTPKNISLASIIAPPTNATLNSNDTAPHQQRPHSTGFYVDMSTADTIDSPLLTTNQQQSSESPANKAVGADRSSHLFSMFIDFAEPSIHSPKRPMRSRSAAVDNVNDPSDTESKQSKPTLTARSRPAGHENSSSSSSSSNRHSWSLPAVNGDTACFTFETQPKSGVTMTIGGGGVAAADAAEDSCSGSVISADHGYQSMPLHLLTNNSRSRTSVRSLASNASIGSSREDVTGTTTTTARNQMPLVVPLRRTSRHRQQQLADLQTENAAAGSGNSDLDDTFSRDSVESLGRAPRVRESSFSDAEEAAASAAAMENAAGVRRSSSTSSTASSHLGDLPAMDSHAQPLNRYHLRKNNSLSHVGERELMLRAGADNLPSGQGAGDGYVTGRVSHTMESLQATMERQQKLLQLETVNEETPLAGSAFVRLSDMDRQPTPERLQDGGDGAEPKMSRSTGRMANDKRSATAAMFSGRAAMTRSMGTNLSTLASTEDTLRSLSRLFPHLSQELALSPTAESSADYSTVIDHAKLPARHVDHSMATTAVTTPANDNNCWLSDLSAVSSAASSFSRSGGGLDSADEWSLSSRQPRRLGEDLLKMFLQEIATDVTLEVAGRSILAHKCILRSRCQYFAAMLAGPAESYAATSSSDKRSQSKRASSAAVQQHEQRIQLAGYSFGSVHFALCHIYSGATHPPHGISLFELAALADMLALEGLKEVTAHALRSHYCHNFHKPCSGCIDGIMSVFPVTLQHGLDDLYHRCLRWTCKHYVTVWSTRAFALLPVDLIERCVQYVVAHVNSETVLTLLLHCDGLVTMLSSCRWAIGVENVVRDLMDTARTYVADHFANLLASDCFLSLGQDQSASIAQLEMMLLRTAATLTPEQACKSYQRANRLNVALRAKVKTSERQDATSSSTSSSSSRDDDVNGHSSGSGSWNEEFLKFVEAILTAVEGCLIRQCSRAMRTQQWQRMELELRKRIQGLAGLTDSMDSKRSSKNNSFEPNSSDWRQTNHNQTPYMHEVKMAIETLSKRSRDGRYPLHGSANAQQRIVERLARPDPNLNKVTKLRKPTAVPKITTSRPHTIHIVPNRNSTTDRPAEMNRPNPRLFKHSISLDVPISHRPPPSAIARNSSQPPRPVPVQRSATTATRFAEIRPRYLEPKARHQSVDNLLTRAPNALSSSSSHKDTRGVRGCSMKSINTLGLSRDSLASTATTALGRTHPKQYRSSQTIMSQDSLNSRKTALNPTQRSMSRDSLAKSNSMSRLRRPFGSVPPAVAASNSDDAISSQSSSSRKDAAAANTSHTTTSRLSSGGTLSAVRIHGDTSTGRKSMSAIGGVVQQQQPQPPRKSFINAKSREILAKRNALNRCDSMRSGPTSAETVTIAPRQSLQTIISQRRPLRNGCSAGGLLLSKSSSTSNIPTSRKYALSTGPQLRQTVRHSNIEPTSAGLPIACRKAAQTATNMQIQQMDMERREKHVTRAANAVMTKQSPNRDDRWMEPRMERSMTFCKESSDLDASTLTIVE